MITGSSKKLQIVVTGNIKIILNNKEIKRFDHTKSLGLHTDRYLSCTKHIDV